MSPVHTVINHGAAHLKTYTDGTVHDSPTEHQVVDNRQPCRLGPCLHSARKPNTEGTGHLLPNVAHLPSQDVATTIEFQSFFSKSNLHTELEINASSPTIKDFCPSKSLWVQYKPHPPATWRSSFPSNRNYVTLCPGHRAERVPHFILSVTSARSIVFFFNLHGTLGRVVRSREEATCPRLHR